jgi:pimeloyl-ACP methyl ester carboxylesterase
MRNRHIGRWRKLTVIIFALGVLIMLTALQRQLIYFPSKAKSDVLSELASRMGLQAWRDSEGMVIGWKTPGNPGARYRMLVFHGNAGYALDRNYFVTGLRELGNQWDVFLFEYPGYGAREGTPSEANFKATATQALQALLAVDSRPIFITGESLGSGVASFLAATFPKHVAGLLLVTPFSSLADVGAHHYPFLPVRTLLGERYDSREALSHYRGPVAFLLAGRDEVVTTESGQQLYDSYSGPKWLHVETHAGHNTLSYNPGALWWGEVSAFLTSPYEP